MFRPQFYHALLVAVWTVLGLILRIHNLALKPLWADECSTLVFSLGHSYHTVPLGQLISAPQLLAPLQWDPTTTPIHAAQTLLSNSNHPPLFFALMHSWIDGGYTLLNSLGQAMLGQTLGDDTLGLIPLHLARSLSALFGCLGIPLTYLIAKHLWHRDSSGKDISPASSSASYPAAASASHLSVHVPDYLPDYVAGHFSALLMALSPFGIYLAQEARHYTLTILWILGSLLCLVTVLRTWRDRQPISLPLMVSWITLNGLGLATHYFFCLTLLAEVTVLVIGLWILRDRQEPKTSQNLPQLQQLQQLQKNYRRLGAIVLGTIATGAVWFPFLLAIQQGDELTRWIQSPQGSQGMGWSELNPILNTLASVVTMLHLLPIQGVGIGVAIASGIIIALATGLTLVWLNLAITATTVSSRTPTLSKKLGQPTAPSDEALTLFVLGGVILSAIALMWGVTYGLGMDISQAFRYHFVYFPAVILLLGWGLAQRWPSAETQTSHRRINRTKLFISAVFFLSLCGALTVSHNLAYQKIHRPDRVADIIMERSRHPLLIAISHQSHGQTGRLMSLAWALEKHGTPPLQSPQFFLDHQPCDRPGEQNCNAPSPKLLQILSAQIPNAQIPNAQIPNAQIPNAQPKPYDLWLINYQGQASLKKQHCTYRKTKRVDGYKAQHYTCGGT